jgi:phage terminase large subunit
MTKIRVPKYVDMDYAPRYEMHAYHERKERWAAIVAHRRYGKTVGAVQDLIKGAMTCRLKDPRFAYVAPTYGQAKDVAWEYLKKFSTAISGIQIHEAELRVDYPNGARVRLYGSDHYDRMRGIYLDGVVNDEYGDQDPRAWTEVIRPALSDRKGWATFIGTPKGDNHFKELWDKACADPAWFTLLLKASKTKILDPNELSSARSMMSAEQYAAEYECSFEGSVIGSYYGEALGRLKDAGQIGDFGWMPDHAVHTAWDTGGTTAIWFFQLVGSWVRVIEYMEAVNKDAAFYTRELKSRPYTYGTHIGPFDADLPKEVVGKSWKTSFEELELFGWEILPKQTSVDDGINQVQLLLPRCQFNTAGPRNAGAGLQGLQNYRRQWDDNRKKFRDNPLHDWASHPADGMRHLALGQGLIREARIQNGTGSDWGKPLSYNSRGIV